MPGCFSEPTLRSSMTKDVLRFRQSFAMNSRVASWSPRGRTTRWPCTHGRSLRHEHGRQRRFLEPTQKHALSFATWQQVRTNSDRTGMVESRCPRGIGSTRTCPRNALWLALWTFSKFGTRPRGPSTSRKLKMLIRPQMPMTYWRACSKPAQECV